MWFLKKNISWILLITLSVACSLWYYANIKRPVFVPLDDKTLSTTIDTIVTELHVRKFDTNGNISHSLHTTLMQHIPDNNKHILQSPHIVVKEDNQAPWDINAEEGTAINGGQQITFNKNVIIHQKQHKQTAATTLKTEEIVYFPKDKLATTLKEVTLSQSHNKMQSKGMNVYLSENRVQFLSNARGHYEPENKPNA